MVSSGMGFLVYCVENSIHVRKVSGRKSIVGLVEVLAV